MMKFFDDNPIFTTTDAHKAGIDKQYLRRHKDIVCLGAFPVKQRGAVGKEHTVRRESVWTYDPRLSNLIKESKKIMRQGKEDEVKPIVNEIESIIRGKLGFDNQGDREDKNGE